MTKEWYYGAVDGQSGPHSEEEMQALIDLKTVTQETLVWHDGMANWQPAGQVEGLLASEQQATSSLLSPAATSENPYQVSEATAMAMTESRGDYPSFVVKKTSFTLLLIFSTIVPVIAFIILIIVSVAGAATAAPYGESSESVNMWVGFGVVGLMVIAYGSLIIGSILGFIQLYRAWYCLQPGGVRTTPGKAVGFLFIPFFNLYWYFIAYMGLANDWNRVMDSHKELHPAPRLQSGLFLALPICYLVFPLAAGIIYLIAHYQMCKGIDFMAARSQTATPA